MHRKRELLKAREGDWASILVFSSIRRIASQCRGWEEAEMHKLGQGRTVCRHRDLPGTYQVPSPRTQRSGYRASSKSPTHKPTIDASHPSAPPPPARSEQLRQVPSSAPRKPSRAWCHGGDSRDFPLRRAVDPSCLFEGEEGGVLPAALSETAGRTKVGEEAPVDARPLFAQREPAAVGGTLISISVLVTDRVGLVARRFGWAVVDERSHPTAAPSVVRGRVGRAQANRAASWPLQLCKLNQAREPQTPRICLPAPLSLARQDYSVQ